MAAIQTAAWSKPGDPRNWMHCSCYPMTVEEISKNILSWTIKEIIIEVLTNHQVTVWMNWNNYWLSYWEPLKKGEKVDVSSKCGSPSKFSRIVKV